MANNIVKSVNWEALLDAVYKQEAKTSGLDSGPAIVQAGANAGEFKIAKIDMQGLGDYDRSHGYTHGDVSLTWGTYAHNFERGRMFVVDDMDDEESQRMTFANLAGEFIRTKVVPELDAFRFATYAAKAGTKTGAALTTGEQYIAAIRAASTVMDDAEVTAEGRILYITSTGKGLIDDLDTTKSKMVMSKFAQIIEVPVSRFYTAIEQLDGKTAGEEAGGYKKATGAKDINFLIVEPSALIQATKHVKPKIVDPDMNQDADAWKFGYRNYGIADVHDNKLNGVLVHHSA